MATVCRSSLIGWRMLVALLLAVGLGLAKAPLVSARLIVEPAQTGGVKQDIEPQDPARILQLRLQVMPEFDDPRLLVIGQGRLAGGQANAPWHLSFWIPEQAQVNLITGMISAEVEAVSQPYKLQADPQRPGWALLSSEFDSPHFFFEYYYAGLGSDPTRPDGKSFDFVFSSPNPVESLSIELQQPRGASNFTSEPPTSSTRQDDRYALTYHILETGPLEAGQAYAVRVSYTRTDPNPSIVRQAPAEVPASMVIPPAEVSTPPTQRGLGSSAYWVMGGVFLLLGVSAAVAAIVPRRRYRVELALRLADAPEDLEHRCPVCGQVRRLRAMYCHRCGSRLNRETTAEG